MQSEGYIIVDHSASPGLPEDVARLAGYDPALVREGKVFESATLSCEHCKTVIVKNLFRTRARENCPKCSHRYICDFCAADMHRPDYLHTPFEKVVDDKVDALAKGMVFGTPPHLLMPPVDPPKLLLP